MTRKSFKLTTGELLYITLVCNVKNGALLKKKVISQELLCGFINPKLILDPFQIAVAADKAVIARNRNKLVTKTIYSEILFNLSSSKHILKSLNTFGSQDTDENLLVIVIGKEEDLDGVLSQVEGTEVDISKLEELTDLKEIQKEYNIKAPEPGVSTPLNSIVTRMAAKQLL